MKGDAAGVAEHLGLAITAARDMHRKVPGVERDELMGYAMLGLCEAAERFDPARGTKFSTFAVWTIRGHVLKGLNTKLGYVKNINRKRQSGQRVPAVISLDPLVLADERLGIPDPSDPFQRIEDQADFLQLWNSLNGRERSVLALRLRGLSDSQIGKVIGHPSRTIWNIRHRIGRKYRALHRDPPAREATG